MDPIAFYRQQWRRYLLPPVLILVVDFIFLFVIADSYNWRFPAIAILSGALGGFVRFQVGDQIPSERLNDTAIMFRYWASLIVGCVFGIVSYMVLADGRLLKIIYPTASSELSQQPSAISVAIIAGFAGLLAKEIVAASKAIH